MVLSNRVSSAWTIAWPSEDLEGVEQLSFESSRRSGEEEERVIRADHYRTWCKWTDHESRKRYMSEVESKSTVPNDDWTEVERGESWLSPKQSGEKNLCFSAEEKLQRPPPSSRLRLWPFNRDENRAGEPPSPPPPPLFAISLLLLSPRSLLFFLQPGFLWTFLFSHPSPPSFFFPLYLSDGRAKNWYSA